jgi:hypothetical protein
MGLLAMWYVAGCENGGNGEVPKDETRFHVYDINAYPLNKVVCDPGGGGGGNPTSPKNGIKSELFYRSSGQPRFYKAEDYHQNYFNENGDQPYCQFVVKPKVEKFQKVFKDKLKQKK